MIVLAKNKLNTIDILLSSALNDSEISHEEFTNIINEENIYEMIKENIKNMTEPIDDSPEKSTALYNNYMRLLMIKNNYMRLLMIKIIKCDCKLFLMIEIITCTL